MCRAGKGIVILGVGLEIVEVASAPKGETGKQLAGAGGAIIGSIVGAKLGGLACAWGGVWGVGICGVGLGVLGAFLGEEGIEELFDQIYDSSGPPSHLEDLGMFDAPVLWD